MEESPQGGWFLHEGRNLRGGLDLQEGWNPDDRWNFYRERHSLREKAVLDSALGTHEAFSSSRGSLEEMAMENS
jgi:hypothetical protein